MTVQRLLQIHENTILPLASACHIPLFYSLFPLLQVKLLNYGGNGANASRWKQTKSPTEHDLDLKVARGAALALWSCSKSVHSRSSIFRAGSVPLLAKLVKEDKDEFLIPVVGLVQECAVEVRPKDKLYIILLTSLLFAATLTKVKKNKTPKPWCAWNDGNSGNIALHFSFVLLAFFLSFVPIFPLIPPSSLCRGESPSCEKQPLCLLAADQSPLLENRWE